MFWKSKWHIIVMQSIINNSYFQRKVKQLENNLKICVNVTDKVTIGRYNENVP